MNPLNVSDHVREYLGMDGRPVGIKIMKPGEAVETSDFENIEKPAAFCYFVRQAASGKNYLMGLRHVKCNNAELTLGLRQPRYGDVELRLKEKVEAVRIGPLEGADVVLLNVNPQQVMTAAILIEGINMRFRRNRAVCGDSVVEVMHSGEPRVSFLCVGSRTVGGFQSQEMVLAMPYQTFLELPPKMGKLASVSRKAQEGLIYRLTKLH